MAEEEEEEDEEEEEEERRRGDADEYSEIELGRRRRVS